MSTVVLGIDPGLKSTGYAIVKSDGRAFEVLEAGRIATSEKAKLENRLKTIYDGLSEIMNEFNPQAVAVEELYSHYDHPITAVIMGHARGLVYLCASHKTIPVISYASTRIKKSLTGNGRASKMQMQRNVKSLLKLSKTPEPPDVADAIAVALCHIEASR